jgi:hypothetical protein
MMSEKFSFRIDRLRGLVRITMQGLFTLDDVAEFVRERSRAHRDLGCEPNMHLTLNDVRGMKIQSQEVVTAFREMLDDPEHRSRRLAFVVAQTLARGQLIRALSRRKARCFEDPASAEAWLLTEDLRAPPLHRARALTSVRPEEDRADRAAA